MRPTPALRAKPLWTTLVSPVRTPVPILATLLLSKLPANPPGKVVDGIPACLSCWQPFGKLISGWTQSTLDLGPSQGPLADGFKHNSPSTFGKPRHDA